MSVFTTHTGFAVSRPAQAAMDDKYYANPLFNQLYLELTNTPDITKTWAWRKRAIVAINKAFLQTPRFFRTQIFGGQPMAPRNVDFLHSTLTFILTGKRKLTVDLWSDLLDYHPTNRVAVSDVTKDHFEKTFGTMLERPVSDLIAMWIAQPAGLHDLIVTAHLIFGALPENWREV